MPDGFKVELLHSATKEEGSWICMTVDSKGRLIISPQANKQPLLRLTLTDGKISKLEKIELPVWEAMGLLHAFDSLYVNGKGSNGLGLYRLRDTNQDDQYDQVQFLKAFKGDGGEHGPHAVVLGPDQMLYIINGNFVRMHDDLSPASPHRNYAEDQLLPRANDGNGFGVNIPPPGGHLLRTDPEGKNWELYAAGMRNAYDLAFNEAGEMFTFDSDMEWDWGTPWYRPVRVYHLVSGGDYGFREGTGKWPAWQPDNLPPTLDIGIGSPTGVRFGTGARFPIKYQKAFYVLDWSYGRILAVHLQPDGASYRATSEPFVVGKPLNVTDLEVAQDGALYFITGGRGTQSGLYRVSYPGFQETPPKQISDNTKELRDLRKKLESFHGKSDSAAIDFLWPHLDHSDRWIRYAARIALESQRLELWQARALKEKKPGTSLSSLLALARIGPKDTQNDILERLEQFSPDRLDEEQKLEALRIISLTFIRMGKPNSEVASDVIKALDPLYPSASGPLNRELSQLLIYLEAPGVVKKSLSLLGKAKTQEEQIHYIFHLRNLKTGWTLEERQAYFSWFKRDRKNDQHPPEVVRWFKEAGRDYADGASFPKFMANIRKDAMASLNESERPQLESLFSGKISATALAEKRTVVKDWTIEDLVPALDQVSRGRSFARGKNVFALTQCLACHRFGNDGGAVGPDLTGAASRFNRRDLLETIIEPSKVVSDQYQHIIVSKKDGEEVIGRLVEENDRNLVMIVNPFNDEKTEVRKRDVKKREPSKLSPMPEDLVNILTKEEILDLLAYIESGGKSDAPIFR